MGCANKPVPALILEVPPNAGNAPVPAPTLGARTDARNGFTAPRPTPTPVACGRSPTPSEEPPPPSVVNPPSPAPPIGTPVGWVPRLELPPRPAPPLVPAVLIVGNDTPLRLAPSPTPAGAPTPLGADCAAEAALSAGVVGSDCGIGGSASSSDAPNDDVGLKALTPALKPVVCGRNGAPVGWLDRAVLPVGCPPKELKSDSEIEPVAVAAVRLVGIEVAVLDEPREVSDDVICIC